MRSRFISVVALVACGLLVGCKRLQTGAREEFARRYSCPDDRIELKARSDLSPVDVLGVRLPEVEPPQEVKKDPSRYVVWEQNQAKARRKQAALFEAYEVFEVTGCGHASILACRHPPTPDRPGYYPALVTCQTQAP